MGGHLHRPDGQHLYVAGVVGGVAGSSNGGTSWTVQEKRFPTRFGAMHGTPSGALDANHLWTGGGLCALAGTIVYRSSDGGQN